MNGQCVDCGHTIPADADPPTCIPCRELNRLLVLSMIEESKARHPSCSDYAEADPWVDRRDYWER